MQLIEKKTREEEEGSATTTTATSTSGGSGFTPGNWPRCAVCAHNLAHTNNKTNNTIHPNPLGSVAGKEEEEEEEVEEEEVMAAPLLRPAVQMFCEDSQELQAYLRNEEQRYVMWECAMEKAVVLGEEDKDDGDDEGGQQGGGGDGDGDADGDRGADGDGDAGGSEDNDVGKNGKRGGKKKKKKKRVVLLELGCGLRVPSVRIEMEEVLRDLLDKLARQQQQHSSTSSSSTATATGEACRSTSSSNSAAAAADAVRSDDAMERVTLVRINTDFPQNPLPHNAARRPEHPASGVAWEKQSVCIKQSALKALRGIERHMAKLKEA